MILYWSPTEIGGRIIYGFRKDRGVSFVDEHCDHQEGFFLNRLITDFEPMALRLSNSGRRYRARPKHESAWCFKVIFNSESWVSVRKMG